MTMEERAVSFSCNGSVLCGIVHLPTRQHRRGVLIVVGGPQYRAGSHRQFVLLARQFAASGWPVMRFDYRGMGDSHGEARTFEDIGDDIRSAVDAFVHAVPDVSEIVLWGLCDAASANLMYCASDDRVAGLVLANPWVRTTETLAKAYARDYYGKRILTPDFWRKIFSGRFNFRESLRSLAGVLAVLWRARIQKDTPMSASNAPLPERMASGLRAFRGPALIVLSGDDLTASEFRQAVAASNTWQAILREPRVTQHDLPAANHTFARVEWRDQIARWTTDWLKSW